MCIVQFQSPTPGLNLFILFDDPMGLHFSIVSGETNTCQSSVWRHQDGSLPRQQGAELHHQCRGTTSLSRVGCHKSRVTSQENLYPRVPACHKIPAVWSPRSAAVLGILAAARATRGTKVLPSAAQI